MNIHITYLLLRSSFSLYSWNCCLSGELRGDGRAHITHSYYLGQLVKSISCPEPSTKLLLNIFFQKMASCYGDGDGERAGTVCEGLRGREGLGHILPLRWTQRWDGDIMSGDQLNNLLMGHPQLYSEDRHRNFLGRKLPTGNRLFCGRWRASGIDHCKGV